MRSVIYTILASGCLLIGAPGLDTASAQTATGVWEASLDTGQTWTSDRVQVREDQNSVLVRLTVLWTPPAQGFAFARHTALLAGVSDDDLVVVESVQCGQPAGVIPILRQGPVITIGEISQVENPFARRWLTSTSVAMQILLDGSPGDRVLSTQGRQFSLEVPLPNGGIGFRPVPIIYSPLTISVVPAPSATIALFAPGLWVCRRRRSPVCLSESHYA